MSVAVLCSLCGGVGVAVLHITAIGGFWSRAAMLQLSTLLLILIVPDRRYA